MPRRRERTSFPLHCELGVLEECGSQATWGGDEVLAWQRLAEAAWLIAATCADRRERMAAALEGNQNFGVTHAGRLIGVGSVPDLVGDTIFLDLPTVDGDFDGRGLLCVLVPLLICAACMAAHGRPVRIVMYPPPRGRTGWMRKNHFRRTEALYCPRTRRPFWTLTPSGLAAAAATIYEHAPQRKLRCVGTEGELEIRIDPRGTPFSMSFITHVIDLLRGGDLTVLGWPKVDPVVPMCAVIEAEAQAPLA